MLVLPPSPQTIDQALQILAAGGVVAHATETCYGLACDLSNPDAVAKLFAIKGRATDQPVSALFPSIEEAKKYVEWNDRAEGLALKHLPGPLTLILPRRKDAPPLFICPQYSNPHLSPEALAKGESPIPTIGIRISSHPLAMELATRFGKPLSTTSANIHGKPSLYSVQEIERQFVSAAVQPDLILDSGKLLPAPPSTIIDLTQTDGAQTRRQGGLSVS